MLKKIAYYFIKFINYISLVLLMTSIIVFISIFININSYTYTKFNYDFVKGILLLNNEVKENIKTNSSEILKKYDIKKYTYFYETSLNIQNGDSFTEVPLYIVEDNDLFNVQGFDKNGINVSVHPKFSKFGESIYLKYNKKEKKKVQNILNSISNDKKVFANVNKNTNTFKTNILSLSGLPFINYNSSKIILIVTKDFAEKELQLSEKEIYASKRQFLAFKVDAKTPKDKLELMKKINEEFKNKETNKNYLEVLDINRSQYFIKNVEKFKTRIFTILVTEIIIFAIIYLLNLGILKYIKKRYDIKLQKIKNNFNLPLYILEVLSVCLRTVEFLILFLFMIMIYISFEQIIYEKTYILLNMKPFTLPLICISTLIVYILHYYFMRRIEKE